MRAKLNIVPGERYGRLTVVSEAPKRNKKRFFLCVCDCGKIAEYNLGRLTIGQTKSCGCFHRENLSAIRKTHGLSGSPLYQVWSGMKARCLNPKFKYYKHYGGRGITICAEWLDFKPFKEWAMANGYTEGLTIERKDNNGNYSPENCMWTTTKVQARNRRSNVIIEFNGVKMCRSDWATKLGVGDPVLAYRIKSWGIERAITYKKASTHKNKK